MSALVSPNVQKSIILAPLKKMISKFNQPTLPRYLLSNEQTLEAFVCDHPWHPPSPSGWFYHRSRNLTVNPRYLGSTASVPAPGNLVWAMTLCRQGAGHLSAAITHHHPVAGASSNQTLSKSSSPFQLVRQHISWCPWCPAQRCRSRLSRTSLSTHITLKIAFQTYLS